jgi:hypothetical protein
MQANPDKCQALAIGKNTFKEQICFDLNGSKIKCEEHVKLAAVVVLYGSWIYNYLCNQCLSPLKL